MPKFLQNPASLTKDQLKSELLNHGVSLPRGDQRKQVYINLYLKHLTSLNEANGKLGFSSDEEEDEMPSTLPPARPKKRKPIKGLPYDVTALSDGDLARQLRNSGQVVGPITDTTRTLYQKKLIKILQEEAKNPETFQDQPLKPRPLEQPAIPKAWELSDEEEEPTKPVSSKYNKKDEEVVMIEDNKNAHVAVQDTPAKESTPKVVRTETIVSQSYIETRKRVVANNKSVDSSIKSQQLATPVKTAAVSHVDSGSWEWKAVLVVLAITTTILLIYYFMEGHPDTPRLKDKKIQ